MSKAGSGVEEAVLILGAGHRAKGIIRAAYVAQTSQMAVYRWLKAGKLRDLAPAMALALACQPKNAAARWALLERLRDPS